ncbi:HEPN domain-containing protein [Candidatus Solincola tengchongensis]|uniref:HEPN domain-containing protein n=1 Tax=Candidatus Solincola tengchongensis TaxID=2900693 RepID=UPI003313098C
MLLDPGREYRRWLEQARSDLDDAEFSANGGRFNLACFLAQQAEKALKAYLYLVGNQVVWGHSVAELVDDAKQYDPMFRDLREKGAFLDRFLPSHTLPKRSARRHPQGCLHRQGRRRGHVRGARDNRFRLRKEQTLNPPTTRFIYHIIPFKQQHGSYMPLLYLLM